MRKILLLLGSVLSACRNPFEASIGEIAPYASGSAGVAGMSGSAGAMGLSGSAGTPGASGSSVGVAGSAGSSGGSGSAGKPSALEVRAFSPPQPSVPNLLRGSSFVPMGWVRLRARGLPAGELVGKVSFVSVRFPGVASCDDILDATLLRPAPVGAAVPFSDDLLLKTPPNDPYRTNRSGMPQKVKDAAAGCLFVFKAVGVPLRSEDYQDLGVAVSLSPDKPSGGQFRLAVGEIHVDLVDGTTVPLLPELETGFMKVGDQFLVRLPIMAEPVETPIPQGQESRALMAWRMAPHFTGLVLRGLRVRIEGLSGDPVVGGVPDTASMLFGAGSGGGGGPLFGYLAQELFDPGWGVLLADPTGNGVEASPAAIDVSYYSVAATLVDSVGVLTPHIDHPGDVRFLDAKFQMVPLICLSEAQPGCEGSGANAAFPSVTVTP